MMTNTEMNMTQAQKAYEAEQRTLAKIEKEMVAMGHHFKVVCHELETVNYFRELAEAATFCAFKRENDEGENYKLLHCTTDKPVTRKEVADACHVEIKRLCDITNEQAPSRRIQLVKMGNQWAIEFRGRLASPLYDYTDMHRLYERVAEVWQDNEIDVIILGNSQF